MTQQERFIQYIQFEKRYSPHTITSYKTDLGQFEQFLIAQYEVQSIENANPPMVRSWLVALMNDGLSTRSVNRKLSSLKSFYHFMMKEGLLQATPLAKVPSPKTSKRLPVFIEEESMASLFAGFPNTETYEDYRNKVLLEVFYATGMRLSELIGLREHDINFGNCTFRVLGKRNKERIIPFGENLKKLLGDYLIYKQNTGFVVEEDKAYLFLTVKGKKLYPRLVYRIVHNYLEEVSLADKKSPHVLRHTFATHMLNRGADLNAIKEILGHASLSATQVYTHNTIDKLKKIYQTAHPKA
jgi:integrase/recombinase XerC